MNFDAQRRVFLTTEQEQGLVPCAAVIPEAEATQLRNFIAQKIGWIAESPIILPQIGARSYELQELVKKIGILEGMITVMKPITDLPEEHVLQEIK